MPIHARGPNPPSPRNAHDIKTVAGGVSEVTSSDSLGPMIRKALNRQRSETKKPKKPEKPRISQVR